MTHHLRFVLVTGILLAAAACSKENAVSVSQAECGDNSSDCLPCTPDELRCDGKTLQRCQADGVGFDAVMVCASDALCVAGLPDGACAAPVCSPGDTKCDGKVMKVCSAGQDGYDSKECPSEGSCQQGIAQGTCAAIGGCTKAADCSGVDTECAKRACDNGQCTMTNTLAGTAIAAQTDGDCKTSVCDGDGGFTTEADPSDKPDDHNDCTVDGCNGSEPTTTFAAEGTSCAGTGKCDGAGKCSTCTPGSVGACANSTTAQRCDSSGSWVEEPCTGLANRCEEGVCIGGASMVRVPSPGGGAYGIDATEVTREQYAAWLATNPSTTGQTTPCLSNVTFAAPPTCIGTSTQCNGTPCSGHPQICVDWCDAYAYCKAVGKRLCGAIGGGDMPYDPPPAASASQWRWSCTSGGTLAFPYGDDYNANACNTFDNDSSGCATAMCSTAPVGNFSGCQSSAPGYGGVFDQSGNVWEWVDACSANLGKDDSCRLEGGAYHKLPGESDAAWPDCSALASLPRMSVASVAVGFRCCSD